MPIETVGAVTALVGAGLVFLGVSHAVPTTQMPTAIAVAVTTFLTQSRISWRSAASRNPASIAASSDSVNRSTYSVAPQG